LRKAYLRLSPVIGSNGGASFSAVTNDQGTFAIENIAPGEYRLDAECVGFLDTQYGGGSPSAAFRFDYPAATSSLELKST